METVDCWGNSPALFTAIKTRRPRLKESRKHGGREKSTPSLINRPVRVQDQNKKLSQVWFVSQLKAETRASGGAISMRTRTSSLAALSLSLSTGFLIKSSEAVSVPNHAHTQRRRKPLTLRQLRSSKSPLHHFLSACWTQLTAISYIQSSALRLDLACSLTSGLICFLIYALIDPPLPYNTTGSIHDEGKKQKKTQSCFLISDYFILIDDWEIKAGIIMHIIP